MSKQSKSSTDQQIAAVIYCNHNILSLEMSLELVQRHFSQQVTVIFEKSIAQNRQEIRSLYPIISVDGFEELPEINNLGNVLYGLKIAFEKYQSAEWFCFMNQTMCVRNKLTFEFPDDPDVWFMAAEIEKVFANKFLFAYGNGFPNNFYYRCNPNIYFIRRQCLESIIENHLLTKTLSKFSLGTINSFPRFNLRNLETLFFSTLCYWYGKKFIDIKNNINFGIRKLGYLDNEEIMMLNSPIVGPVNDQQTIYNLLEIARAK